ncbi:MAG: hypothetical protein ACTSR1_03620 [Candidatus Heimdallarchaeota archaeon]
MGLEPIIIEKKKYSRQEKIIIGLLVFISLGSTMSPILFLIDNEIRKKKQTTDMLTSFILAFSFFLIVWSADFIVLGVIWYGFEHIFTMIGLVSLGSVLGVLFIPTIFWYCKRTKELRKKVGIVNFLLCLSF